MNRKKLAILLGLLVAMSVLLAACGGLPRDVKDTLEAKAPGSEIISVQKAQIPDNQAAAKGWCVVTEKGKNRTSWVVLQGTVAGSKTESVLEGADYELFQKFGCTNWSQ